MISVRLLLFFLSISIYSKFVHCFIISSMYFLNLSEDRWSIALSAKSLCMFVNLFFLNLFIRFFFKSNFFFSLFLRSESLFFCLSQSVSIRLFIYLSLCLPVKLSVCLSVHLPVYVYEGRQKSRTWEDFQRKSTVED